MSDPTGNAQRGGGSTADAARTNFKRYRAPSEDGQALFDPAWHDWPQLVLANHAYAAQCEYDFLGVGFQQLRAAARGELLQLTGQPADDHRPLVLTGHQPELFHPGVWLKNFAAGSLAQRVGGLGVNLVIDSDLCRSPSVRVPTGSVGQPRAERVAYDATRAALPFEQRAIADLRLFEQFPAQVTATGEHLLTNPMLPDLWPAAVEVARRGGTLGEAVTAARHATEHAWGNTTREAPISRVCDGAAFARFAADILLRLAEFHAAHNGALAEYRTAHKLRSPAQPMPDLHQQDGWLEAPLWVWTDENPVRRPLYAKRAGSTLELTDQHNGWQVSLQRDLTEQLQTLREQHGLKLRSRALVTTLFARLLLADVFLHGIGGAKYDEAADLLAERFYGFAPPPHATLTATLRLPIEHPHFDPNRPRQLARELRELEYHPEKFLVGNPAAEAAGAEKVRWITTAKTPQNAAERHRAIVAANASMQRLVQPRRKELLAELDQLADASRAAAVLESREYAYCLFPAGWLRERLAVLTRAEWAP